MSQRIIYASKARGDGKTRYFVPPVETADAFTDLRTFICDKFGFREVERLDGIYSVLFRLESAQGSLTLVFDDLLGAFFLSETPESEHLAASVAREVEQRMKAKGT